MLNKLKYITALLLIVIFPISAVGLNISIHKCQQEGSLHLSVKTQSDSDCCCSKIGSENQLKSQNIKHHKSNSENSKTIESCSCCSPVPGIAKNNNQNKTGNGSSSCCGKSKKETNNTLSVKVNKDLTFAKFNHNCCSNTKLSYHLNNTFLNFNDNKNIIDYELLFLCSSNQFRYDNKVPEKISFKEIIYPLKEPICNIISFIHFTSSTGDESDVSSNDEC